MPNSEPHIVKDDEMSTWPRLLAWTDTKRGATILLLAILVLGAIFRFYNVDWDDGTHLHPDERFLTMVENGLEWPDSLSDYWDSSINPLSPYNKGFGSYVYGIFPVVLAKAVGQLTGYTGYSGVYLAGRVMSGVMDLACVLIVYLIGKALYNRRTGLLSALLFSMSVLSIQHAHFFTVDSSTTFFVTLALLAAVRVAKGAGWGSVLLLGFSFGMAVSSKISVLTFLAVIGLALIQRTVWACQDAEHVRPDYIGRWRLRLGRVRLTCVAETPLECPESKTDRFLFRLLPTALTLVVILVVALFTFRIAQPQAFTGPGFFDLQLNEQWLDDMESSQKMVTGETDYPPSDQWTDRTPVWYSLKNMVLWGLGVPLGLAVWASWGLMAYDMFFKKRWQHLLPWTWMTLTFFYQSVQFVKTVRYMLPIYPTMALVAGYGLMYLCSRAKEYSARRGGIKWPRVAAYGGEGVVVLGTLFYAISFMGIYSEPVTRLTASRWIYENIPEGTSITYELWDDALPLNIDGHNASIEYDIITMDLYWEDIEDKRESLYNWLDQADYIILSSNRLYGSIPRMESRYPMATAYYEALFDGDLGFELVAEFTSRPSLLGFEFVDDNADETFTVYDHPRVLIYRKTADYDPAVVQALFDDYDLERIARTRPVEITEAPTALLLSDKEWEEQQAGGTWSEMFDRDSLANSVPTLAWLLILLLLAVPAFVLGFPLFSGLRDRGYGFALTLGLVVVGWLSWLGASVEVLPFTQGTLWCLVAVFWALAIWCGWRNRAALSSWLREHWQLMLAQSIIFMGAFALFWLIRRANPDLWHSVTGGEKPMDLAYLNAIIKSTWFPAYDPWFAGGYINYYYFGYVLSAVMVKLSAVIPTTAYNLLIPTFFAMLVSGIVSLVYNLRPRAKKLLSGLGVGLVGAVLAAIIGNLGELELLWGGFKDLALSRGLVETTASSLSQAATGFWTWLTTDITLSFRPEWWYWNASRIMANGEINEFPFFSFLYGDLHAHVMAMPLAVLALGLAVNLIFVLRDGSQTDGKRRWLRLGLSVGLSALVVGALWCTNTWDYPTYLLITIAALAVGIYAAARHVDFKSIRTWVLLTMTLVALSIILYLPFHSAYGSAYSSFELWEGETSTLSELLTIWIVLYVPLLSGLLGACFRRRSRDACARRARLWGTQLGHGERRTHLYDLLVRCQSVAYGYLWILALVLLLVEVMALFSGSWALFLALPVLALGGWLALRQDSSDMMRFAGILAAVGAGLVIAVEYVVLDGDIGRMNTVFKFYLQAWILWAVAAALLLPDLLHAQVDWRAWGKVLWRVVFILLLVAGLLYPVLGTWGKVNDKWDSEQEATLDGTAFMKRAMYNDGVMAESLNEDLAAIEWLQENVEGSPVVMEGVGQLYRWGSRVSIYTGLPTVIGWDWHQRQQRSVAGGTRIDWRLQDVSEFYNTEDISRALEILDEYDVAYVMVGQIERSSYTALGLSKFTEMEGQSLEVVFSQGNTVIYKVIREDKASEAVGLLDSVKDWLDRHWVGTSVLADEGDGATAEEAALDPLGRETVDSRGWNSLAAVSDSVAIVSWWLVLWLLGLAAWPLIAPLFEALPGKGYGFARTAGLLLGSLLLWLGSSLEIIPNSACCAWAVLGVMFIVGICAWRRQPALRVAWRENGQDILQDILRTELIFTAAFVVFVIIRMLNSDLWQPWYGGEKMMEIAFLNATSKSAYMPPYDPYLSGLTINYYYYGLFVVNFLQKLAGLTPEVAFNLAIPTFFALTISIAYSLGRWLTSRLSGERLDSRLALWGGVAAAACVALLANLSSFAQLLEQLAAAGGTTFASATDWQWSDIGAVWQGLRSVLAGSAQLGSFDYWSHGTRIIPYTINEFPFFSFLFADLHPHMIAIPFMLFIAALAWAVLAQEQETFFWRRALCWFVWAVVALGALGPMNTWSLPAAVLLLTGALVLRGWRQARWHGLGIGLLVALALVLLAVLLYAPFYATFDAPESGLSLVSAEARSAPALWFVVWGTLLIPSISYLVWQLAHLSAGLRKATWGVVLAAIVGGVALGFWVHPVVGLCAVLVLLSGWGALTADSAALRMIALLLCIGWGMLLCVELVYLPDFLDGGDWFRMNTVFKFGIQSWILIGLAVGATLPLLWRASKKLGWGRWSWRVGLLLVLFIGFSYVPFSIPSRIVQRFPEVNGQAGPRPVGLDGLAYMDGGVYTWPDASNTIDLTYDYEAITWLWNNVEGAPVLLEAYVGYYREGGMRVSSYTGLAVIVGAHSGEQHDGATVLSRQNDVSTLYNTTDEALFFDLLSLYDVRYIYVGQLENAMYNAEGLEKFEQLAALGQLQCVYQNTETAIYEVPASM